MINNTINKIRLKARNALFSLTPCVGYLNETIDFNLFMQNFCILIYHFT